MSAAKPAHRAGSVASRRRLRLLLAVALTLPFASLDARAQSGQGADIQGRFQAPSEERRIEVEAGETRGATRTRTVARGAPGSLEERLYLRERPDAVGDAARSFHDSQLERLLTDRERLLGERRAEAIRLLEEFIAEEPETAAEMPDALLRLAELRWEEARAGYLTAFAAWQQVPEENRSADPPRPDYTVPNTLYDRILERHRGYDRYDLVLYMKAFVMMEAGRPDLALGLYARILNEFPQSRFVPDAHMAHAEGHFAEMEYGPALARYELVLRHRESDLYGLALFKSAWCLWRLDRTREAALRFRRVLDLGRGRIEGEVTADQRRRLQELQSEALEYLIQVFTEDENNTAQDLFAFLEEIGGERYADRVLVRLASRFFEQDRWDRGNEAYELLIERMPNDERAPRWQLSIASGHAALGLADQTIDALGVMAARYLPGTEWARAQTDPERVTDTRDMIERALRVRAMRWHDLGQRENTRTNLERAERTYGLYLEHFGDEEQSYEIRFYRGEILFHRLERWEEAARAYYEAAEQNPTGRYSRDALYNAIGAMERVREAQLARCTEQRGGAPASPPPAAPPPPPAAPTPAATAGAEGEAPAAEDPCAETENDRRFASALELYVEHFPDDPDLPEILFRQGRLYYDREVFDPAVRLFGQLLERFPQSPYAVTAGELILESFNRAQDYQNIETWARRLKSSPAFQTAESQRRLDALILQAVFATGEQLAGRGEHTEAASAYLRAAREFPTDDRAPQAYFNAGVEFQRAGELGGASEAYEQLIERHAGSEIGARGAWAAAQMFESIAQFRDAARFYESYATRFPQAGRGADALYNATLLRVTAGDHGEAVQNGERFLERFARHDSATEVVFLIARAHESAERWQDAARVYRDFVRRTRDADRQIEAQTRMGQALLRSGDARAADRVFTEVVRDARRRRANLTGGLYYAAQARFLQAEAILREYEAIEIAGPVEGLRQRLERKSELLRRAAEAFAEVVELNVAEWVAAALFQIGNSYEIFARALRDAPIPEGLTDEEEMAYTDQLASFIIPIEERALEAFEGGYRTALQLRIFNRWTQRLREGLVRLNDVQYPPLREMGGEIEEAARLPMPAPLTGLRRGPEAGAPVRTRAEIAPPEPEPEAEPEADARPEPRRRRRPRRRRQR